MKNRIILSIISVFVIAFTQSVVFAGDDFDTIQEKFKNHPTGLDPESYKMEMKKIGKRITRVKPNELAIERKNIELKKLGKPLLDKKLAAPREEEIITINEPYGAAATDTAISGGSTIPAAATQVDNTTLSAFPPIWTQGQEGSCFPFNLTYYVMSHETCLVRGCNNKSGDKTNLFSPRFIYNFVNQGANRGCCQGRLVEVLSQHGAPNLNQLPYVTHYLSTNSAEGSADPRDYRPWELRTDNWINNLNNRMNSGMRINVTTTTGIENAKQMLANGHVMLVATYIYWFKYKPVGVNPSAPSPYAGQQGVGYLDRALNVDSGGHAMTIAGYDDSIWIDANNNGVVDAAELGAFKVVNSWGTGWYNGGYVWVSYDAFKTTSAIAGLPSTRNAFTQDGNFLSITARGTYSPKVLAKFTVNHQARNQMSLSMGVSSTSSTSPTTIYTPAVMQNQGGAYAFDGSTTAVDGTFVFDFSDIVPTGTSSMNYYFTATDNFSGNPLVLKDFRLIDVEKNIEIPYSGALPLQADASSARVSIGYSFSDGNMPPVVKLYGTTQLVADSSAFVTLDGTGSYDQDGSISSYTWNFGDGTSLSGGSTATHTYTRAGTFSATLTVTDNKGASSTATYSVIVPDTLPPTAPSNVNTSLVQTSKRKGKNTTITYGVKVAWTASTDNVGVSSYRVYRNNILYATTSSTSITDNSTAAGNSYSYYVIAVDAANNTSPSSNIANISR